MIISSDDVAIVQFVSVLPLELIVPRGVTGRRDWFLATQYDRRQHDNVVCPSIRLCDSVHCG